MWGLGCAYWRWHEARSNMQMYMIYGANVYYIWIRFLDSVRGLGTCSR